MGREERNPFVEEDDNHFEEELDKNRDRHDLEGRAQAAREPADAVASDEPAVE